MNTELENFAVATFLDGFNCSQAVLSVFAESLGLLEATAMKIACGFGAGMGRLQETCGAVTGAFMVIGLKYGKSAPGEDHLKEKTYAKVKEFSEKFKAVYQTTNCRQLLGDCDFSTEAGRKRFQEENLSDRVCSACVRNSVRILNEILE